MDPKKKRRVAEILSGRFICDLFSGSNRGEIVKVWGRFSPYGSNRAGIIRDLSRIFHVIVNVPFEFSIAAGHVSVFGGNPTMRIPMNLMDEKILTYVRLFSAGWTSFFRMRKNEDALSKKFVHLGFFFPNVLNACINRLEILSDMIASTFVNLSNRGSSFEEAIEIIEGALLNCACTGPRTGFYNFDISEIIGYLKSRELRASFSINVFPGTEANRETEIREKREREREREPEWEGDQRWKTVAEEFGESKKLNYSPSAVPRLVSDKEELIDSDDGTAKGRSTGEEGRITNRESLSKETKGNRESRGRDIDGYDSGTPPNYDLPTAAGRSGIWYENNRSETARRKRRRSLW